MTNQLEQVEVLEQWYAELRDGNAHVKRKELKRSERKNLKIMMEEPDGLIPRDIRSLRNLAKDRVMEQHYFSKCMEGTAYFLQSAEKILGKYTALNLDNLDKIHAEYTNLKLNWKL